MEWPDVEAELVSYLTGTRTVRVCTDLPADLLDVLPVLQVQRVGGTDDGFRLDRALIDVDAYALTRADASALARAARDDLVIKLRGVKTAKAVFGRVSTVSAPMWRPYENPALRKIGGTYEVFFHPVS
jgi:hypothetical protein